MIEWFGGEHHLIELSIPLFGLGILFAISRVVDTNRSKRYFALGFSCWFGLELLIGLENGSLVSLPSSIGIVASVLLLLGFVGFTGYAFLTVLGAGSPLTTTSS